PISIVRLSLFPHVAPTKIYSLSLHDALPISDLIEKLIESKSFVNFMERQSEKTPMDFNNDLSRYEGSVATACSGHVYRFASSLDNTQVLKHTFADMTENDWIYTAYLMTKHIVPEREKHTEIRDGLPWLLYNAQSGWTFIRAK